MNAFKSTGNIDVVANVVMFSGFLVKNTDTNVIFPTDKKHA